MWIRIAIFAVSMLLLRKAETTAVKNLSASQTDDLLDRLAGDSEMPRWARVMAKAPWLYRRAPIDVVPDGIPFIGKIDDKFITSLSLMMLSRLSPKHLFNSHVRAVDPDLSEDA